MNGNLSAYDGLAGVILGIFILTVILRGNGGQLVDQLKKETGFVKWAASLLILGYIGDRFGGIGAGLALMVYILLAMKIATNPDIMNGIKNFWSTL